MSDIGTPLQAIQYVLVMDDAGLAYDFLHDWAEGNISEWPGYAEFLKKTRQFEDTLARIALAGTIERIIT